MIKDVFLGYYEYNKLQSDESYVVYQRNACYVSAQA